MEINLVHQSGTQTHIHSLFNTHDDTDATTDGDKSCTSVRYTDAHRYTLSLKLMIIQTPRQMEIHHVHQSVTHTYTLFNFRYITGTSVRYTNTHTLSL